MNEMILVIVNKSSNEQNVSYSLPVMYKLSKATDLLGIKNLSILNNRIETDINGLGYLILKLE
jgi:hypothetical protein